MCYDFKLFTVYSMSRFCELSLHEPSSTSSRNNPPGGAMEFCKHFNLLIKWNQWTEMLFLILWLQQRNIHNNTTNQQAKIIIFSYNVVFYFWLFLPMLFSNSPMYICSFRSAIISPSFKQITVTWQSHMYVCTSPITTLSWHKVFVFKQRPHSSHCWGSDKPVTSRTILIRHIHQECAL